MTDRPHIFDFTPATLRDWIAGHGMPAYRADQLLEWVYQKGVTEPQRMTNLPKAHRDALARDLVFTQGSVLQQQSASDGVRKLLIQWPNPTPNDQPDNTPPTALPLFETKPWQTECVLIPSIAPKNASHGLRSRPGQPQQAARVSKRALADSQIHANFSRSASPPPFPRRTACVSSQAGCPVGCTFCASGLGGLDGNLTAGQIVEQVWRLSHLQPPHAQPRQENHRVTHVVFMGMGEPLANFENVTAALRTLTAPWGLSISARRITLSTVGLPAQIRRLADLQLPVNLALSIHAPNDELRRRLIPWAQYVTLQQLVDAATYYYQKTHREVTFEYTLLHGVNDQPDHARQLAALARKLRANVNLIRYNEVNTLPFNRPTSAAVLAFQATLRRNAVNTHIRASRGRDIAAACGQLKHQHTVPQPIASIL